MHTSKLIQYSDRNEIKFRLSMCRLDIVSLASYIVEVFVKTIFFNFYVEQEMLSSQAFVFFY